MLFSTTTILLLAIFQMIIFILLFLKVANVLGKKWSVNAQTRSEAILQFHGIPWMALGVLLGAAEVTVGFAPDVFGVDMARRSLTTASRMFIMIASIKG